VNISSDQANIGAGPAQRPNISGNPNDGPKTPDQWFYISVFSLPQLFTFGNAPRNAVIGPGLQEFDFSLQKDFRFTERTKLQFRTEAYNLLNHPNFNIPSRTAFTANFGSIRARRIPDNFSSLSNLFSSRRFARDHASGSLTELIVHCSTWAGGFISGHTKDLFEEGQGGRP
jgi:hypothetical protein